MPLPRTTARLSIDYLAERDLGAFLAYRQDPAVARLQGWEPTFSESDARDLLAGQPQGELPLPGEWAQIAVREASSGALLGDLGLHVWDAQPHTFELGCTMAPGSQGHGFAEEAVTGALAWLFAEHGAHRVVAFCDARNDAVGRLVARVGMRQESQQREADFAKGEWTTVNGYAILASEWATRTAPTAGECSGARRRRRVTP